MGALNARAWRSLTRATEGSLGHLPIGVSAPAHHQRGLAAGNVVFRDEISTKSGNVRQQTAIGHRVSMGQSADAAVPVMPENVPPDAEERRAHLHSITTSGNDVVLR